MPTSRSHICCREWSADQSNLILDKDERPDFYRTDDRWLGLAKATEVKVVEKDIRRWAAKPKHGFSLVA